MQIFYKGRDYLLNCNKLSRDMTEQAHSVKCEASVMKNSEHRLDGQ